MPDEGLGAVVPAGDPGADVGFQLGDAAVHAAAQQSGAQFGEEAFDEVEPGAAGRGEVQVEPGMAQQPAFDLGVLWVA